MVYEYLNSWIEEDGLDAFCEKKWSKDEFVFLTDTINHANKRADGKLRTLDNVRREVRRLYEGRLGPLAKLKKRSESMKKLLEQGAAVEDGERFPEMAIPVPTLVDGVPVIKDTVKRKTKKRGRKAGDEDDVSQTPAAKKQKKDGIVKLPVNWNQLHVQENGKMVILEGAMSQNPAAEEEEEDGVVKLPVDWSRIHTRSNGQMVVLEEGEVWESPSPSEDDEPQMSSAEEQDDGLVKLAVDWSRLHIRENGKMVALEEGQVWESPSEDET